MEIKNISRIVWKIMFASVIFVVLPLPVSVVGFGIEVCVITIYERRNEIWTQ